ncbi:MULTISPECIES: hypothetical protein [unclassified Streptomyces]|uniref:hypothetical protein n=1 Tax=unclassified Streptomyces TaxID=2593676 RepID=UPI003446E680
MTTMPGSLPLARHYYETRREVLATFGTQMTPWYRLTAEERDVAVAEAAISVEAVRRANEERASLQAAFTGSAPTVDTAHVVEV